MAQKQAVTNENDSGFLLLRQDDTPESRVTRKGWAFDQPGVLVKTVMETKDASGAVIATDVSFAFKPGATIYEHCVGDQVASGDLVGGDL